MAKPGALVGFGNPLLDISAPVPEAMLTKYGLKPFDAILAEEKHLPLYDELIKDHDVSYLAGGATQNSIRFCQWMLGEPKGACAFVGCVGNDENGQKLRKVATDAGVDVQYLVNESHPTGTCACLITNNERSLVANLAAANEYCSDHFHSESVQKLVSNADIFYISSFFLTASPETTVEVAKRAAADGKILAMNLAAPFLLQVPPLFAHVKELIPYMDYVFGNEHEGAAIGKAMDWGEDLKVVAEKLAKEPKENGKRERVVLITQGPEPVIVAHGGQDGVKEYGTAPCPKEELVDLNGAGDAFVGGFLSQLVLGKSLDKCIEAGHYLGGVVIRRSGPTVPEVCTFSS